jgi:hypothetical protein
MGLCKQGPLAWASSRDSCLTNCPVHAGELAGPRLRELVVSKYGKEHDFAFVRRDLPLGKTLVCLNIMFPHLGNVSWLRGWLCLEANRLRFNQAARHREGSTGPSRPPPLALC